MARAGDAAAALDVFIIYSAGRTQRNVAYRYG